MPEVEPNPTWQVLRDLVASIEYRPDWKVCLTEVHRQVGGPGLRLDVHAVGYNSYHIERGQTYRVRHSFIVPPASYNVQSWTRWLFERFVDIETHEACEFFRIVLHGEFVKPDGTVTDHYERRPFAPNHGKGHDPYMVRELNTKEAAETTFQDKRMHGTQS